MNNLKMVVVLAAVAGTAIGANAQWGTTAATNLKIADLANDQVQPKIGAALDGGCYVSWFDNRTGGYDVYLQRLNAQGFEQWPHNGILICDRSYSSTVDYDMIVDAAGNAIVAYNDNSGGSDQISVSKVDPSGSILWKTTVTSDSTGKANPHICQLSDGSYMVGYSYFSPTGTWFMQHLDSGGTPQLPAQGIQVAESGHYEGLADLKPAGTGFAAMWVRGSGTSPITSSKGLYLQKYDAFGAAQWNGGSPVIIWAGDSSHSIQNGYFPTMIADGAGGVVVGWYAVSTPRSAFIQHVLSGGTLKFAAPVANTGPTAPATRIRVGAGAAYNLSTGEYYLASPETDNSTQSQNSTFVQKFDSSGNLLWGDTGATIIPISSATQQSFVQCQAYQTGCMVFFEDTRSATTNVIDSARVDGTGTVLWHNLVNSDSSTGKSRLTSTMGTQGFAMVAYGWGNTGSTDIAAQNINGDGTLGYEAAVCYANCDASTVAPILNANDFQCFLNKYAANDPYANCDGSTVPPILNANDFQCFLNAYAAGCT